jgi:predicted SAM-dependent methyltransferase
MAGSRHAGLSCSPHHPEGHSPFEYDVQVKKTPQMQLRRVFNRARPVLSALMTKRRVAELVRSRPSISLELGSGEKLGTGDWVTLDFGPKCDLTWDLRKGIPFPDNSVSKIYSSHLLEHLKYDEIVVLLKECLRVLSPGGSLSACVPNAGMYFERYLTNSVPDRESLRYEPAICGPTPIDAVNYIAYMNGQHKYMFDQESLISCIDTAGFSHARLREFDPNLDTWERDYESIYAEATS